MDSVRSFMLDIERGRRESQRLRDAMSKTDPLYPYQPQPHELQALSLWRCICAHHNVLDSGLAPNPVLAKNAANAGGSNEEATQKLMSMVGLYELARPHLGGELRNAGDGTCLKWLREWMTANGLGQDGAMPTESLTVPKRMMASTAQDAAILQAIRSAGYDPKKLPKNASGKGGVKQTIRKTLAQHQLFHSRSTVFRHAWERLRSSGEIADAAD